MKKISRCMTRQQFSQHFLSNKLEQKYEQSACLEQKYEQSACLEQKYEQSACLEQRHQQLVTQLWGSSLHISP
jgi:hypothetical protein